MSKPNNIYIDPFLPQYFNDGHVVVAKVSTLRDNDGYSILKEFHKTFDNKDKAKAYIAATPKEHGLEIFEPEVCNRFEVTTSLDKSNPF